MIFIQIEGEQTMGEVDVKFSALCNVIYAPAVISGPPEHCHPDESEVEITQVLTDPSGFVEKLDYDKIEQLAWDEFEKRRFG